MTGRLQVTAPASAPSVALVEADDEACLINAGPPDNDVAPSLVRRTDATVNAVVATDADEAHLGDDRIFKLGNRLPVCDVLGLVEDARWNVRLGPQVLSSWARSVVGARPREHGLA